MIAADKNEIEVACILLKVDLQVARLSRKRMTEALVVVKGDNGKPDDLFEAENVNFFIRYFIRALFLHTPCSQFSCVSQDIWLGPFAEYPKAQVTSADSRGKAALHYAARNGHVR